MFPVNRVLRTGARPWGDNSSCLCWGLLLCIQYALDIIGVDPVGKALVTMEMLEMNGDCGTLTGIADVDTLDRTINFGGLGEVTMFCIVRLSVSFGIVFIEPPVSDRGSSERRPVGVGMEPGGVLSTVMRVLRVSSSFSFLPADNSL